MSMSITLDVIMGSIVMLSIKELTSFGMTTRRWLTNILGADLLDNNKRKAKKSKFIFIRIYTHEYIFKKEI